MDIIGPLQVRIMHFIWEEGRSTVHEVHDALNLQYGFPQLAYTTILTVMRNLHKRNMLSVVTGKRSHVFSATVTDVEYKKLILVKMGDEFFDGDIDAMISLMSSLVET